MALRQYHIGGALLISACSFALACSADGDSSSGGDGDGDGDGDAVGTGGITTDGTGGTSNNGTGGLGTGGSSATGGTDGSGGTTQEPFVCPVTEGFIEDPSGYCYQDVGSDFPKPPEATGPIDGAPAGTLTDGTVTPANYGFNRTFPYTVYVPAQYDGSPAALMVIQDRVHYLEEDTFGTTQVLDNLIHAGEMPVTIAIFNDPNSCDIPGGQPGSFCRDEAYNRSTADFANFVVDELVPQVATAHSLNITTAADGWAAMGFSAGGAASLGMAYHRPDKFQRAVTHAGSFVATATRIGDAVGAEIYTPGFDALEPTALRITLSTGPNDIVNADGSWLEVNRDLARVLDAKGNHYRFSVGGGGHYPNVQGGAMLPDDLRFVWADY